MSEWKPIESAPKDGTAVLGYFGHTAGDEPPDMSVCRYNLRHTEWESTELGSSSYDEPTHWMPLPEPPA